MQNPNSRMPKSSRQQRGITLVEMMVAITVGLILLAGIVELFVSNKQAFRLQEGSNALNENARYLLNQIEYDLRMAGFWGGVPRGGFDAFGSSGVTVVGTAPVGDCTQSPALSLAGTPGESGYGVEGFDGAGASPLSCIAGADYQSNTDILIVRHGGAERMSDAQVVALPTTQFVRTDSDGVAEIFNGNTLNARYNPGPDPAANPLKSVPAGSNDRVATYLENVAYYFVRPCASKGTAATCGGGDSTPTLTRLALRSGSLVQEDIMAGVEQFQVLYGVDTVANDNSIAPTQFLNATAVTAGNFWDKVSEVRISFVLRNLQSDPAFTDTSPYLLYNGATGSAGVGISYTPPANAQHFHRKVFRATVQIRNLSKVRG